MSHTRSRRRSRRLLGHAADRHDAVRRAIAPRTAQRDAGAITELTPPLPCHELVGPSGAPVIVVLGGISATRHVTATPDDLSAGWWQSVVGPARTIDTTRCRVLSIDYLDGGVAPGGRPAAIVTTHDQADALARVLDAIGIARVQAIVGASYGGMVALAFAEHYGERVEQLVVISAAHEPHPMSTALRTVQRGIVQLGLETGRAHDALVLARALAVTTYRSAREFAARFDSAPDSVEADDAVFPVQHYLRHHGERFALRWRAERFLALSLSGDLHRVDPRRIRTPTVLIAAEGDTLVPLEQMERLTSLLDGPSELECLPTIFGHDAFLAEPAAIARVLTAALSRHRA